jgi:hypothetical protein
MLLLLLLLLPQLSCHALIEKNSGAKKNKELLQ